MRVFKKIPPARLIALGFFVLILIGTGLLLSPFSIKEGMEVSFIDALFTATSAVCVTGLTVIDISSHFTIFGQIVMAFLIQAGGLGVTLVSVGLILFAGGRIGLRERLLVRESINIESGKGIVRFVKSILFITLCFELTGAILSFTVFIQKYPLLESIGISIFHAISAFNNAGFDIMSGGQNLIPYQDNIMLNLVTCGLIIFGGIGFLVIMDIIKKRSFKKLTLHSKIVIMMTVILIVAGTLLFKATEDMSWLGAFFNSVSCRTAGFSTYPVGNFTNAGLFIMVVLMFIGASPGSTGGGIKTTTFFTLLLSVKNGSKNNQYKAFRRRISAELVSKAAIIAILGVLIVSTVVFLLCVIGPDYDFLKLLVEVVSAYGTVGFSSGISSEIGILGKFILAVTMYIGRVGSLTIISLWFTKPPSNISYSEESIAIG